MSDIKNENPQDENVFDAGQADAELERLGKILLGTMTLSNGETQDITMNIVLDLIRTALDKEHPDADAADKLKLILGSMLEFAVTLPDVQESPAALVTLDALRTIYEYLQKAETEEAAEEAPVVLPEEVSLPSIAYKKSANVELSIDKFSSFFTGVVAPKPEDIDGQLSFNTPIALRYEKKNAPNEITLTYSYSQDKSALDKLGIHTGFSDYDFFVQTAIDNLLSNGNQYVTYTQIYKEMHGNRQQPTEKQLTPLKESLIRGLATTVIINDREVMEAWNIISPEEGKTYEQTISSLLPIKLKERFQTANGKKVMDGVKILDAPPIPQIGKQIGQYTTIPKALLENNIKKTPRYYSTMHFLLINIARMRDGYRKPKIIYETFYTSTGQKSVRDRQLAKKCLFECLDHFIACGWITGSKEDVTKSTGELGIKIQFDAEVRKRIAANKKLIGTAKK